MNRTRHMIASLLVLLVGLLAAAPAFAQEPASSAKKVRLTDRERQVQQQEQAMIEQQARDRIEALFGRLCPGRCELVDLNVEMKQPQPVGEISPGFESVNGASYEAEPKTVQATVLLDAKLPRNFQSNIPRMLQYRLGDLAPTVDVRPEVLDFPEPQLAPTPPLLPEPPRRQTEPPPPMEPLEEPVAEEAPAEEATPVEEAEPTLWERLAPFLEDIAPWIGPIIMVIVLFALMMMLLRRLSEVNRDRGADTHDTSPAARRARGEVDVEQLQADLTESRALRNRVLRRWLEEDEEAVARLVRLMGPAILADLKSDPQLKGRLETVSELVGRDREPLDDEEIKRLANETQARITSARVIHDEGGLAMDFEFLEGVGVANLRRILQGCSTSEKVYVVGQLPPSLRSAFLETLDQEQRRELFLGTSSGTMSKQEALALAARLRKAADEVAHIGKEADGQAALVMEMLSALGLEDQQDTLRELKSKRPEVAQAVLGRICLETTTMQVPGELLADAIHRTPVETLASFLRGTRADVRDHILSVAPSNKRTAVMTELSLDVPVGRAEFLTARETVLDVLKDVLRRDGHDLVRANNRALMTTSKINPVTSNEASV